MNFVDMSDVSGGEKTKQAELNYGNDAVLDSIRNIVMTPIGSMPGHPEFGSNLNKYLFRTMDPLVEQMIKTEIESSLLRWEPRIKISSIEINEDLDYNRLSIKINYTIIKDPDNIEREFIFKTSKN